MLLSNISNSINIGIIRYTELLNSFDIPQIQACYDWHGWYYGVYKEYGYKVDKVLPSSPVEFSEEDNFVYSLKK